MAVRPPPFHGGARGCELRKTKGEKGRGERRGDVATDERGPRVSDSSARLSWRAAELAGGLAARWLGRAWAERGSGPDWSVETLLRARGHMDFNSLVRN
jgi:hypothetical protein